MTIPLTCAWCTALFVRTTTKGPVPTYCRPSCRQRAHEARHGIAHGGRRATLCAVCDDIDGDPFLLMAGLCYRHAHEVRHRWDGVELATTAAVSAETGVPQRSLRRLSEAGGWSRRVVGRGLVWVRVR